VATQNPICAATLVCAARQNVRPLCAAQSSCPEKQMPLTGTQAIALALSAESYRGKMIQTRHIESGDD
jgi:hypothetical protein